MMNLFRETENLATILWAKPVYTRSPSTTTASFWGFMKPTARDFMGSGSVLQQVLSRAGGTGDFCLASPQNPSGACLYSFLSPGPSVPKATGL